MCSSVWEKKIEDFIYLCLDRREGREKERERNINVCLPLLCPLLKTWPATQACALTGNRTSDPLVHRPELSPLSHTSQSFSLKILICNDKLFGDDNLYPRFNYFQVCLHTINI